MINFDDAFINDVTITEDNYNFYRDCGYLIATDLISEKAIDELRKETVAIFRGQRGIIEGLSYLIPG